MPRSGMLGSGERDLDPAADDGRQLGRLHGIVGVAEPPELVWIPEIPGGDVVEPITPHHEMLGDDDHRLRWRHEPPEEVRLYAAVRRDVEAGRNCCVPAGDREHGYLREDAARRPR